MRGVLVQIGVALVLATSALTAGCGGDAGSGSTDGLAALTPPDAPLFIESVIDPNDAQAAAINSFADRVGGISDPGAQLISAVDGAFSTNGLELDYASDVAPWIGDHAALFVSSFDSSAGDLGTPDFAVLVEAADEQGAGDFVSGLIAADGTEAQQRSYNGVDYSYIDQSTGIAVGVFAGSVVVGTERAFKVAVDASEGESLADSADYTERTAALDGDPIASIFLEPAAAIEAAIASEGIDPAQVRAIEPLLGGPLSQPIAASLSATTETASLDVAAMVESDSQLSTDFSLLNDLPGDSWLAIAVADLGPTLERSLDQLTTSGLPGAGQLERQIREATGLQIGPGVLDWLGDAAGFIEGTSKRDFGAGVIAEVTDPDAPKALLDSVQAIVEQQTGAHSSGPPQGADYGFSVGMPGSGDGFEAGVVGDKLVGTLGVSIAQALDPSEPLGLSPDFRKALGALGSDLAPELYVDLPSFFKVAELGSDGSVDYEAARPYLSAFASLIAGSRLEGELVLTRVAVSLAD